ncbi:Protein kinase domain [Macleaya cordata]|uniref:non-specific serine/threonine protein kinase n=1 Tax=Macleaya cordata TaxID=56857 RepID=A0A200QR89_MACCD|nr:Protein kinase domain [Macleaya cordata]
MEKRRKPNFLSLKHLCFLFFFLFLFCFSAIADDSDILKKLSDSLKPTPSGWSGSDPCKWSGINCDASNRVTSIDLSSKSLSGSLPSDLNQLSQLNTLNLQRNKLSGPLPNLSDLAFLREIFLDTNNFTSVPPKIFSGLTSLQILSLSDNVNLEPWDLPQDLTQSASLVTLYASNANLMGSIPDFVGSFMSLQDLRLSYNNLTGPLPSSLAGSDIRNLWINNQVLGLSGSIDVLGTMTQLSQVWLHKNMFTGPIPDLSNCTSLFDLQLRDNRLTGIVPPTLTSLPQLLNVSLANNKLQGPYPGFKNGVNVVIGDTNNFCTTKPGPCDPQVMTLLTIAGALGYPNSLADSWVGNNPCQSWTFITCDSQGKNVTVINFAKQHFVGTISPAIGDLTSLRNLFLNDNNLTGSIPESLTGLTQLQTIDVSNNNLTGKFPGFSSKVTLKSAGNPLLGVDVPRNTDSGSGSGPSSSKGQSDGPKNSSVSAGMIAGVVIAVLVFMAVMFLVGYKYYKKKQNKDFGRVESPPRNGKEIARNGTAGSSRNGYGGVATELNSQSSGDNSEVQYFEGGNVAISIEVIRQVTENFSEKNILGRGGFGVVYKGELHDGTQIAVKRMESNLMGTKGLNEFQAEIAVLTKVRHRHLVALLGFCVNGHERLLVYEYMPQGTLSQHLFDWNENGGSPLTWKQRVSIALDVARGVEYLHSLAQQSFIHRDLKPTNILLGDDMRAKVADFGLVKNAPDGKYSLETRLAGTFGYLAPEYAATGRVTRKVDVYAYGVVLMELLTGRKALDENLPDEQSHLVTWFRRVLINKDNIIKAIDPTLDPDEETFGNICTVAELAGHCTARDPSQRPEMGHAVNVLGPLVEQWKPTRHEEEDAYGIDLHMSLPQALQRWQSDEGTSTMATDLYSHSRNTSLGNTQSSIPPKPSGLADTFNSMDCR